MPITRRHFIETAAATAALVVSDGHLPAATADRSLELYHPRGYTVWDTWYLQREETTHVYHLQKKWPGSGGPPEPQGIGHATSKDLIHWTEQPPALQPGPKGSYDEGALFTGCAVEHSAEVYLFYCSNQNQVWGKSCRQAMSLATSTDGGKTFEKYAANPIIEPDPDRYYSYSGPPPLFKHHAWPWIDCRDLAVVKHPERDEWLGYVVMRRKETDAFRSSCIALCRSRDLIHWSVGPPCCTPNRFNCFEVPDVFRLDGVWYMIALTGDGYGQSERWTDKNIKHGTIAFRADAPEGPFEEIKDNILLASTTPQGFSARTVECRGERLMFYTRKEAGGGSRLSWPVKLISRREGGLLPTYWPGVDKAFGPRVALEDVALNATDGVAAQSLGDITGEALTFMLTADMSLGGCEVAGIGFRLAGGKVTDEGYAVMLDRKKGEAAILSMPGFVPLERIQRTIDESAKLRVIVVDGFVEVYVNDVLVVQRHDKPAKNGVCAVLVNRGSARFSNLRYCSALG